MANYLVFIVPGLFWSLIGIEKGALTKTNCEFCCWHFVMSLHLGAADEATTTGESKQTTNLEEKKSFQSQTQNV